MATKAAQPKKTKKTPAKEKAATDTPTKPLAEFIENVNKRDRPNGRKIRFAFVKRKR
jgi:hypothetical protein